MDELLIRLSALVRILVPFVFFMASVYLVLHIAVARLVQRPDSPVLWFFSVVTDPLTRPVRRLLPADAPEGRVRAVALGAYAALWLVSGAVLRWLALPGTG
jgi:hypothetical protein